MANDFHDYFVGEKGYDALKKLMKSGNDFCIAVAKCLQERNEAEANYVRALRKSSDTLQKLAGQTKGTLAEAFKTLASQTSKEAEAHSAIADTLLNDISIPMRNFAETQIKKRKPIEETLNGKFKEWNVQKDTDNKYRTRQFDRSREIENLSIKISELPSTTKSSIKSKASSVSTPLVSCILPGGRNTSASEKLEMQIRKAEEELERTETKYHLSTRNVELLRQECDAEMYRSCDELQKMEFERITEMANYIRTYTNAIHTLSTTMQQVTQDLYSIQVSPPDDIIVQVKSNVQPAELDILLYDIYAENTNSLMNDQRRILSLMRWMEWLRRDIEIQQQQTRNKKNSSAPPLKSNETESPDEDIGSSSDGAMCSRQEKDIVVNSVHHGDGSSSSSNDDDGAMYHTKREKKKKQVTEGFSSEIFVDQRGAVLLEELYRASLFKIETVYNRIKGLSEPRYQYEQLLTHLYNDKNCPTTLLRLPAQQLIHTPPSAPPPATNYFIQAMPMFNPVEIQRQPFSSSIQRQAPPAIGWPVQEPQLERAVPVSNVLPERFKFPPSEVRNDRMVRSARNYPVLTAPTPEKDKHVRALYSYKAQRKDELNFEPGDIILLLERRKDNWYKGNLHDKVGLFPGNYVEDV